MKEHKQIKTREQVVEASKFFQVSKMIDSLTESPYFLTDKITIKSSASCKEKFFLALLKQLKIFEIINLIVLKINQIN